jgi:hypothetical protein
VLVPIFCRQQKNRNRLFIMFVGFSSRTKEQHDFRYYLTIVIIMAAMLALGLYAWVLFRAKVQSGKTLDQQAPPPAVASEPGSSVAPILEGDNASTNVLLIAPPALAGDTHSN